MQKVLKKRFLDWDPIKHPVLQNTLVGFALGVMIGINLKAIYTRIHGPAFIWISFFVFGAFIGFLSGLERSRHEKKKAQNLNKS
jgi:hypothetical protein